MSTPSFANFLDAARALDAEVGEDGACT